MGSTHVIENLRSIAETRSGEYPDEAFRVRGLWDLDTRFKPTPAERLFRYNTVIVQTRGQGCCYAPPDHSTTLDENIVGRDARELTVDDHHVEIAMLDAIFTAFDLDPDESHRIRGDPVEKSERRTDIVVDELRRQVADVTDPTVLNVGVLGNVLEALADTDMSVRATDKDADLVGTTVHGVEVADAGHNDRYLAEADVALVTGMTLATRSLGRILDRAREHDTRLVVFAETGSNFAEQYCELGVDTVVREPFPFYIFQGTSRIDVFRADGGGR